MKNFIKENWFKIIIILMIFFGFYWFQIRPNKVRHICANKVINMGAPMVPRAEDTFYNDCLWNYGLHE